VGLTLPEFIARWQPVKLSERATAQSHFIDLCDVLGQSHPVAADPAGAFYTFEKGVTKTGGGQGFADVWLKGHFAWEYKKQHKNLTAAYQQLLQYREDLENPPLLVVCDLNRFEVHSNFTGTAKRVYAFELADLATPTATPTSALPPLEVLRALFSDPERLRPQQTTAQVTEQAAREFATLAESLRRRGHHPEEAAHFLMRLLFCLFAEDIGLLENMPFTQLLKNWQSLPTDFARLLRTLFAAMATGGAFGPYAVPYFDGGLFADDTALELTTDDLKILARAAALDWSSVEPAIFGTLFERSLDPSKRAQLGAHYTSRADIQLIVEPVLMGPLRHRWADVQAQALDLATKRDAAPVGAQRTRQEQALQRLLYDFAGELAHVRVLDPACGSGNFLYVALKHLMDLEKEVISFAVSQRLTAFIPQVDPGQLYGIEINAYAHELAQVVVWIGYIQWLHDNGFGIPSHPILKPLQNIRRRDALLTRDDEGHLIKPSWPEAHVIIGNPPFLGGKFLRRELGDEYVEELHQLYRDTVPREADLVCYWFERAREQIDGGCAQRAGLLATQGIRGGANRRALERIKQTGDIFMSWSDREWVLDGAAVHVSLVGFDGGDEPSRTLNGVTVSAIHADLTSNVNLTAVPRLAENGGISFMGVTKGGPFDIPAELAQRFLREPVNPNGRPNSDVVRPWVHGADINHGRGGMWIIDFGTAMSEAEAALYEAPFQYVLENVKPRREQSRTTRAEWWIHERPRPEMRSALAPLPRYAATSMVSKHRIFVWLPSSALPENVVIVFARADDYFFGVLHSRVHGIWARQMGTQLREAESGSRYTPTTAFETFPFPRPLGQEAAGDRRVEAIAQAARELVQLRDNWLNPPGATEAQLKERTLTNLYNERPAWLDMAHRKLDTAVCNAYGWPHDLTDEQILERLLALNLGREPA
jgi:type II restriction/modification system DNA methylase subunit YeeA